MYKVYVKTDETGRIVSVNSDAFLPDTGDWTQIDEGDGDKFMHAQGNYFPQPLMTVEGVYRYKLADGEVIERTAAGIQADIDAIPPPPPTLDEKITAMRPLVNVMSMGQPAEVVLPLAPMLYEWEEGVWETNRNLTYEGQVYKVLAPGHDSTGNPGWKPGLLETANLFMIWHGVSEDTAQPWIEPTGAHDMYKAGEYMIFTDSKTYECLSDTNFSPVDLPTAWHDVTTGLAPDPEPEEPVDPEEPGAKNSNGTDIWSEWLAWDSYPATLYNVGDLVTHNGIRYISTQPGNHWEPGVYGWEQTV